MLTQCLRFRPFSLLSHSHFLRTTKYLDQNLVSASCIMCHWLSHNIRISVTIFRDLSLKWHFSLRSFTMFQCCKQQNATWNLYIHTESTVRLFYCKKKQTAQWNYLWFQFIWVTECFPDLSSIQKSLGS